MKSIGELIRNGSVVYYAFIGGVYREAYTEGHLLTLMENNNG